MHHVCVCTQELKMLVSEAEAQGADKTQVSPRHSFSEFPYLHEQTNVLRKLEFGAEGYKCRSLVHRHTHTRLSYDGLSHSRLTVCVSLSLYVHAPPPVCV